MDTLLTTKEPGRRTATNAALSARILIIDDDASALKLAADALETGGYVVEQAADERQAQQFLERAIPNLILLDFALPGVVSLARALRTDRRLKHVPIIALTRTAMNGGDGAHEAGCDGCIIGPVDARRLPLQIAAFLVRGTAPAKRLPATSVA